MTIGFFGKGGSGKTTTCFQFLRAVQHFYPNFLAVDADHNMDLSFNLGVEDITPYVGQPRTLPNGGELLAAGPHTEQVFDGEVCSHYLFRPLKAELEARKGKQSQLIVVDNTAGMDSVGAGIPSLLDVAVICVEPALHSIKVAQQIVTALQRFQTPPIIVANKIQTQEQHKHVQQAFPGLALVAIPFTATFLDPKQPQTEALQGPYQELHTLLAQIQKAR